MIAFIVPNEKGIKPLQDYVVTVDSVHEVTGIDFFPCLSDTLRNRLEDTSDISKWDFSTISIKKEMRSYKKPKRINY